MKGTETKLKSLANLNVSRSCLSVAQSRAYRQQAPSRAVGVIHENDDIPFSPPKGTMSLLCTWGVCRSKTESYDKREPYVKVHLKVHQFSQIQAGSQAFSAPPEDAFQGLIQRLCLTLFQGTCLARLIQDPRRRESTLHPVCTTLSP